VEDVVLGGRTPVLAMPATARHVDPTGCAIVAWDGSAPAAAALTRATPLLKRAQAVHIVTVEEADKDRFPSTEAAEYLARYGVAVELHALPREGAAIETILAETAVRLGADWMVMGFYGHGRMREMIFGGVTRALLRDTRIPLLLAH
jgi:nucleotide-binding universal stress UspA family protein